MARLRDSFLGRSSRKGSCLLVGFQVTHDQLLFFDVRKLLELLKGNFRQQAFLVPIDYLLSALVDLFPLRLLALH